MPLLLKVYARLKTRDGIDSLIEDSALRRRNQGTVLSPWPASAEAPISRGWRSELGYCSSSLLARKFMIWIIRSKLPASVAETRYLPLTITAGTPRLP